MRRCRIVRDGSAIPAARTLLGVTAERGRATACNGQQDLDMLPTDPVTVALDVSSACERGQSYPPLCPQSRHHRRRSQARQRLVRRQQETHVCRGGDGSPSLQLRILQLGLFEHGDVRVGVFPELKKLQVDYGLGIIRPDFARRSPMFLLTKIGSQTERR